MTDKPEQKAKKSGAPVAFDAMKPVENVNKILDSFLGTANVKRVYGEPTKVGDSIVIPAAEVFVGMGFGMGAGFGPSEDESENPPGGGGGGAGGSVQARPVAVIIASPEGVRVEPVFDVTKITLAGLTAFGFMIGMVARMRRAPRLK